MQIRQNGMYLYVLQDVASRVLEVIKIAISIHVAIGRGDRAVLTNFAHGSMISIVMIPLTLTIKLGCLFV